MLALGYDTSAKFEEILKSDFVSVGTIITKRKQYKKDGFNIDVDETDFGYKICEIELIIETVGQIKDAEMKIIAYAKTYDLEIKDMLLKPEEYLKKVKLEIFKKIYG